MSEVRLIDANALKKEFVKDFYNAIGNGDSAFEVIGAMKKAIDKAPTISIDWGIDNGEWIPASERLPDDMQRVLIWFEYYRYGDFNCMYQTYGLGYVCDGKWSPFINGETGWQDYSIIAWQPLPKPYMKERKDAESST